MYVVDDDVCRASARDEDDGEEAHHAEGGGIADALLLCPLQGAGGEEGEDAGEGGDEVAREGVDGGELG